MAVNWSVSPLATDGFTGATAIDVNAAAVTVSVSLGLVIPLMVAVMADVPVVMAGMLWATLPMLALYLLGQRFFIRGLTAGGVKG